MLNLFFDVWVVYNSKFPYMTVLLPVTEFHINIGTPRDHRISSPYPNFVLTGVTMY